ncbi:hypothetical protein Aple_013880 [Acrocarpospora pleiomorpha]|uniref:Uncharacterized protein n=1 Tax=Acrocarpospora pleiomorpha TaxID=90975 RepID=A0A5M3XHJ7_9ACTN|nr:CU044_5270 family protein [Acrocarpospora pleiomorpha]GES18493.1 hypothetical protein Aple_013880 [Acrocarpospora pleiomorpha]
MMTEFDDVKRLMAQFDPAPGARFAGAARRPQARDLLLRILESPRDVPAASNLPRRRVLGLAGAAALVSVAGVTTYLSADRTGVSRIPTVAMLRYNLVNGRGDMQGAPPAARAVLLKLAEIADRQLASPVPADAAFKYVKFNAWYLNVAVAQGHTSTAVIPTVVEQWTPVAPSGTARRREHRGEPIIIGYGSPETAAAVSDSTPLSDEVISQVSPAAENLPPDAEDLRQALLRTGPVPSDIPDGYRLVQAVIDLHSEQVISPRLSAALWRMLSGQPHLVYLGATTDRAGRAGEAIAFEATVGLPKRWVLIIDPTSGRLNSSEEILTKDPGKLDVTVPAVIGYKLFLRQGWTADNSATVQ